MDHEEMRKERGKKEMRKGRGKKEKGNDEDKVSLKNVIG